MKKVFALFLLVFVISCSSFDNYRDVEIVQKEPYDNIETKDLPINQDNDKLKVAVLLPLSGKAEKIGEIMLKSAQLSMFNNRLNNIIIMPYDTKGTSFGAVEAINKAIADNVDIVVGPFFTQTTKSILKITDINNLIVLSFSDNESILNTKYPKTYLMGLTPKQEIYRMVSYLINNKGFYGFSAMFPNDTYGNSASKIFKDVIFRKDAKIVKSEFYTKKDSSLERKIANLLNANTFRNEVYQKYEEEKALAKAEGLKTEVEFTYTEEDKIFADALLVPDNGNELIKIAQFLKNSNNEHKPLIVGTSKWLNSRLYNNIDFDNSLFTAPNPNNYVEFENLYYDTFGSYPLRISSLAYDAIIAVMESYAKAQSKENIKYALENYQGFEGINGKFRFLSDGSLERRLAIIRISNGKFEIIDYDNSPFLKY